MSARAALSELAGADFVMASSCAMAKLDSPVLALDSANATFDSSLALGWFTAVLKMDCAVPVSRVCDAACGGGRHVNVFPIRHF